MPQVFLITERKDLAESISRYLRSKERVEVSLTTSPRLPKSITRDEMIRWVPQTFSALADWIESRAEQASMTKFGLLDGIGLIEVPTLASPEELDPIDKTRDWPAVVGMLLLAFPEMHWALLSPYQPDAFQPLNPLFKKLHFLKTENFRKGLDYVIETHKKGFTALFDSSGLRNIIRCRLNSHAEASYVPIREHRAVAIDEEETYSYFNAYLAYRFGFRCDVVISHDMMTELLGDENGGPFTLSFEDIFLNFADRRESLSKIKERDGMFPALAHIPNRIFVTSGHSRTTAERKTALANDTYLHQRKCKRGLYSKVLNKPESGVFNVWMDAGLLVRFNDNNGRAPDFQWPPCPIDPNSETEGTHSAPGRLLLIADRLIHRASQAQKNAESVSQAVYGATLALEAQEYLGHRTPTASLQAIALKHQLEVLAECMFYGIEYNIDTESRFEEIEQEINSVGTWFREKTREVSELNAEIGMVSDLVLTFRNYNQFSEEQAGLSKLRDLHRRLWVKRKGGWAWVVWPIRFYIDKLLGSIGLFIAALVFWILLFGLAYSGYTNQLRGGEPADPPILHGIEDAVAAFFGMQPPHDLMKMEGASEVLVWLTMFIIVMGFVHLGIFVSHLYSIMSRR